MSPLQAEGYSLEELLAVAIAKEVRDGEIVAVGTLSPIPAAAAYLAAETTAPHARLLILSGEPWPFTGGSKEFFDLAQRGKLDMFFLSGAQIDAQGNINLTAIGDYERPKVRLPGGAGSAMLYYMAKRVILFKTDHSPRSFVQHVDFKTSAGVAPSNVYRPGGPWKVVTPLCVFKFDQARKQLVLESTHPGVTVEEVEKQTAFPIVLEGDLGLTQPPSQHELDLLRSSVRKRLEGVYPEFAAALRAPGAQA